MFKFDSTHGRFKGDVQIRDQKLIINGSAVYVYNKYARLLFEE